MNNRNLQTDEINKAYGSPEKRNEAIQNTVNEAQQLTLFIDGDNAGTVQGNDGKGNSDGIDNRG